ncbi:MAG: manganese efflux pump [Bacteroidales bacterium]|nr:manganese efflux pump [Bacteroidales bacterium]
MSIIEFIILSIALSFEAMIVMHGCALKTPVKLTKGLAEVFCIALLNILLLLGGIWLGNLLRFTPDALDPNASSTNSLLTDTDNLVYLGLMILVAVRLLFRSGKKSRQVQPYDISRFTTALLLGIVIGINTLFVGLALGFRIPLGENIWRAAIPMLVVMTLFGLLGVMLGRQQKELRARRYTLIAVLFLLAFALKGALWG